MVDATYQPKVYRTNGGDKQVVASGGELDIESGGTLKLAGTAIAATAAEINEVADKSANAAIAANAATLAVTQALHAGKVVQFGKLDGCIATLPAATGTRSSTGTGRSVPRPQPQGSSLQSTRSSTSGRSRPPRRARPPTRRRLRRLGRRCRISWARA